VKPTGRSRAPAASMARHREDLPSREAVAPTFVLLTRVQPGATASGKSLRHLEENAVRHIESECPGVKWMHSYAVMGPYDYLDVFRAPDLETAAKVSTLVRIHGQATTETWGAVEWERFKTMLDAMPSELLGAYDGS